MNKQKDKFVDAVVVEESGVKHTRPFSDGKLDPAVVGSLGGIRSAAARREKSFGYLASQCITKEMRVELLQSLYNQAIDGNVIAAKMVLEVCGAFKQDNVTNNELPQIDINLIGGTNNED